jgi:hypothetical protein
MLGKSTSGSILSVLLCAPGTLAFVAHKQQYQFSASSSISMRPDGFMEGDRFAQMNPGGYRDQYNVPDMQDMDMDMGDINVEEGGQLARMGGFRGDGEPGGRPMIRMDASAPRHQNSMRSTVQGGSRSTWVSPDPYGSDEMNVHLGTAGRPLHANVEHWSGPGNTPSRMQLYSEDGGARPWMTKFRTPTNVHSGVTQVRNTGPMEFPIEASVHASNSMANGGPPMPNGEMMSRPVTVDGGALKTFGFDHDVQHVYMEISSEGLPVNAVVELWQGPSNTKAIAKIYTDHGLNRPWSALIPCPGYGASICVRNVGPMTYPIKVSMDPPPKTAF